MKIERPNKEELSRAHGGVTPEELGDAEFKPSALTERLPKFGPPIYAETEITQEMLDASQAGPDDFITLDDPRHPFHVLCFCGAWRDKETDARKPHPHQPGLCPSRGEAKPGRQREYGRINGRPSAYERAVKFRKDNSNG